MRVTIFKLNYELLKKIVFYIFQMLKLNFLVIETLYDNLQRYRGYFNLYLQLRRNQVAKAYESFLNDTLLYK
jgi:hypothetical protein